MPGAGKDPGPGFSQASLTGRPTPAPARLAAFQLPLCNRRECAEIRLRTISKRAKRVPAKLPQETTLQCVAGFLPLDQSIEQANPRVERHGAFRNQYPPERSSRPAISPAEDSQPGSPIGCKISISPCCRHVRIPARLDNPDRLGYPHNRRRFSSLFHTPLKRTPRSSLG